MLDPSADVMRDRPRMASRAHWQLAVVGLGTAAVQLDTAVNIAFPAITDAFALATRDIQWVVIAYVLTYSSLLLGFGRLGDRLGHARVFRLGVACTIAAHLLCSLASGFGWLLAARVTQGIGAALVLSCGPALATGLFEEERRTRILGAYALMMGLAATIGPWIGGALVQQFGWQAVFWFRVPVAVVALIAMVLPAVGGQWPSPSAAASAPVGWRSLGALAQPDFAVLNMASVLVNFAAFALWLLAPYYFWRVAGIGAAQGGAMLSIGALGGVLASLAGAALIARIGAPRTTVLGAVLVAGGLALIATWGKGSPAILLVGALALQGIGIALFQLAYTDIVTATLPRADRGVAGSLTHLTRTLGTVTAASGLMAAFAAMEPAMGFLPAFQQLFAGVAGLALAMAILLVWRR